MPFEFKLPDIGEGVAEGEVVAWHVSEGDQLDEDQLMVEVMTDKATVTIASPKAGRVHELRARAGESVKVGDVLVVIELRSASTESAPRVAITASAAGEIREFLPGAAQIAAAYKPRATPATRRLARELGVDLREVDPTGPRQRVTKQDVERTRDRSAPRDASDQTRAPFTGLRRLTAQRMQQAKQTAAHFTFVEECDATRLLETRERLRAEAESQAVTLTFLPFIIKAVCRALLRHPILNSSLDTSSQEIVTHRHCHIGVATASERGLFVPVVRSAESLDLIALSRTVSQLTEAVRTGTVQPDDLTGSTFTITSLGKQAGLFAVPILNLPNVGILGVHRIKQRPVVRDGAVAVGHVMLLSLSLDHRIVDGHVGAAFAYDVIAALEEPSLLLTS